MSTPLQYFPKGWMDKDSEYQYINTQEGNYIHGKNIRSTTNSGATGWATENMLGNLYAANLGSVIAQGKVIRAYVNILDPLAVWEFIFTDANNVEIFRISEPVAAYPTVNDYLVALNGLWNAALPAGWGGSVFNYGTSPLGSLTNGYVEITMSLGATLGIDWYFTVTETTNGIPAGMVIMAEAIDLSMTGYYRAIGSFDLLGELFVWATPCTKMPANLTINVVGSSGTEIAITLTAPHGLTTGEVVTIFGTGINADGIWKITVIAPTAFTLDGSVFTAGSFFGTVVKNVNAYGMIAAATYDVNTDLWTLKKLIRTREFPFRTKKQIQGEVHKRVIRNGYVMHDFYWDDDNDVPRVMYYQGAFVDDGAIDALNPQTNLGDDGLYAYGTISDETRLLLNNSSARLRYVDTTQFGGAVKSGNWLYTYRQQTAGGSFTACQMPTNPVNVYSSNEDDLNNKFILGDAPGKSTPKRVQLEITGLDVDLFKYIELIGINLINRESFEVWSLGLTEITAATMQIEHTGMEPNKFQMSASELLVETINLKSARHIMSLDSILIQGDLTLFDEIDFTPFTTQVWHRLRRKELPMMGFVNDLGDAREFQVVDNVNQHLGLMYNETYRWGMVFTMKGTGVKTKVYPTDDIKVDISDTNTLSTAFAPYGQRRGLRIKNMYTFLSVPGAGQTTINIELDAGVDHGYIVGDVITIAGSTSLTPLVNVNTTHTITAILGPIVYIRVVVPVLLAGTYDPYSGHITGGLPNCQLTNDPVINPLVNGWTYSFYIQFSNFPWDSAILPDGRRLSDVVESFEFVRCECIHEVKMCGLLLPSEVDAGVYIPQSIFNVAGPPVYTVPFGDIRRQVGFFVAPDILFDLNRTAYAPGDQFILFGTGQPRYRENPGTGRYYEFNGAFSLPTTPITITLSDATNTFKGDVPKVMAGPGFPSALCSITEITTTLQWDMNMILLTDGNLFFEAIAGDSGIFNGQYFTPKPDKYGSITQGLYQSTGHYYKPPIAQGDIINNQDVYGGDTFTQKTYLLLRYNLPASGFGIGVSFYSQNRVNSQMRFHDTSDPSMLYPAFAPSTMVWLQNLTTTRDQMYYNKGYSQWNLLTQIPAYNSNLDIVTDLPATMVWSPVKVMGSNTDPWRMLLPLDFKNLDLSKGVLMGIYALNGELYAHQQRAFIRLFFNATTTLKTMESEEIILGSGDTLARNGQTLSTIGCDGKWRTCIGKSQGGNDVLYWINLEHKKFLRFGADGTKAISDIAGMESWFANFTKWLENKDTPADDEGIHMAWDGRFSQVLITFRGRKASTEWLFDADYLVGSVVRLTTQPVGTYGNFAQTVQLYVSKSIHTAAANTEPETGEFWEDTWTKIEHTNTDYYNEYTLVYDERKNGFTCFASFLPTIYLPWTNAVLSPNPTEILGEGAPSGPDRLYLHNRGVKCEWYKSTPFNYGAPISHTIGSYVLTGGSGFIAGFPSPDIYTYTFPIDGNDYIITEVTDDTHIVVEPKVPDTLIATNGTSTQYYISQAEDAELYMPINEQNDISKIFEAMQMNTLTDPWRVNLQTPQHSSYLVRSDFEYSHNYYDSPVKMDTLVTGDPEGDGDYLSGQWVIVGLIFKRFVNQNIKDLIMLVEKNFRMPFKR